MLRQQRLLVFIGIENMTLYTTYFASHQMRKAQNSKCFLTWNASLTHLAYFFKKYGGTILAGIIHFHKNSLNGGTNHNKSQQEHIEVHGFSDASIKAYSAVVYSREVYEDGTLSVSLIATAPQTMRCFDCVLVFLAA